MAEEIIKLAYDEARSALREQDATLANVRNRATTLLAAAAVGSSFSASVGLLNTDPDRGEVFPAWAGWTLLVLLVLVAAGVMIVLWPSDWKFGPNAGVLLDKAQSDPDQVLEAATRAMIAALASNNGALIWRMNAYRATVLVLMAQTAFLVMIIATARG
jgi:hypothetical protein